MDNKDMNILGLQHKLLPILTISIGLSACGSGSDKKPPVVTPPLNGAPVIESFTTAATSVETGVSVRFDWKITDPNGDIVSCKFDPHGNGEIISISDCVATQSTTYTYSTLGVFKPKLTAIDSKNASSTADISPVIVTGDPSISLRRPLLDEVVGAVFSINASVQSNYEIDSVTARIGDKSVALTYDITPYCGRFSCPGFTGKLDLTGLAEGEYTLEIIARAGPDKQTRYLQRVKYDSRPTLTVSSPAQDSESTSVAAPLIPVAASCSDAGTQGCTMRVFVSDGDNKTLASGNANNSINQEIDLSAYSGRQVELIFSATDSANQLTQIRRKVYVEVSPRLTPITRVDGIILDAKDNRLLYKTLGAQGDALYILDRVQNITTTVPLPAQKKITLAFLSNFGAMMVADEGSVTSARVYDWNGNTLYDLGQPNSNLSLNVNGDHAIWNESLTLIRRDLSTLSNSTLTTDAGNWQNSLASSGAVAWWGTDKQIYLNNGTTTQITNDMYSNYAVVTDGNNTVYTKSTFCCTSPVTYAIALFNGNNEVTLRSANSAAPVLGSDYQLRDGWISYTDISNQGNKQVWTYSPLGQKLQRTFFATSSVIDTLGDNGQLMLFSSNKRYLSTEGGPLLEINSTMGVTYYIDNQWFISLGGIFFSVNTL